jgi:hypothetical protein
MPSQKTPAPRGIRVEPSLWICLTILGALPLLFFREILLGKAFLWEDFLYLTYPVRIFAAVTLSMGQLPLWNPYTFNGMPFLADLTTAIFYIPTAPLAFFVRQGTVSVFWIELLVILHYALAGISMFALARSYNFRRAPALFSGVVYMLSGFMITHAIHQSVVSLVAWFPLITLLFRNVLRNKEWWRVFLCAVVLGHSFFAGFVQLSLYFHVFLLSVFLHEAYHQKLHRSLLSRTTIMVVVRAAITIGLSFALDMIQFLPSQEMAELSQRAQITYDKAAEGSLAWSQLLTLVFPKFFGTAGAAGYQYWGPGTYWYYWETCTYLGILPLILTVLAIPLGRKRSPVLFYLGVAGVALLYALGDGFVFHRLMFEVVPGFARFRVPARAVIFVALPAAVLSGFSLQALLYEDLAAATRKRLLRFLGAVTGIGVLLWIMIGFGMLDSVFTFMANPRIAPLVRSTTTGPGLILLASVGLLFFVIRRAPTSATTPYLFIVLFFIDMLAFGGDQNNGTTNPAEYFRRSERFVSFVKKENESEIFRINTRNQQGMILDRNQAMVDRIFTMEGYTPLALQRLYAPVADQNRLFDLLNIKYKTITDEGTRSVKLVPHPTYLPRVFFLYAMDIVRSEEELLEHLKSPGFNHRTTAVLEEDPRFTLPGDTTTPHWVAHIQDYQINSINVNVETDRNGILVFSEMFYPGWIATVDDIETPVLRTDYNLRGIYVSAGKHNILMEYKPVPFRRGALITICTLLVCAVGSMFSLLRQRKSAEMGSTGIT